MIERREKMTVDEFQTYRKTSRPGLSSAVWSPIGRRAAGHHSI